MAKLVRDGDTGKARSTRPTEPPAKPRRFTLSDLLVGAEQLPKFHEGVKSALDGPSVGAELG